jgi:hypothetical protein
VALNTTTLKDRRVHRVPPMLPPPPRAPRKPRARHGWVVRPTRDPDGFTTEPATTKGEGCGGGGCQEIAPHSTEGAALECEARSWLFRARELEAYAAQLRARAAVMRANANARAPKGS